jgi:hypothetical protein
MSELDIDMFRTTGRTAKAVAAELVRELDVADLEMLAVEKGSKAPAIKRISERHHALARAIASGMPMYEAAFICGYDISRVSILQSDPSFQELLAFYAEDKDRAFRDVQTKLAGIASDALDELQTRLEESPEKLKVPELMQLVTMGADRTGNGPTSTQNVNVNENLAQRLEDARKRLKARRGALVDITPNKEES